MRLTCLPVVAALLALAVLGPAELPAQSSLFGVRGLGLPGRPFTPRSRATAGSFALFDGESDLNPATVANLTAVTAGFVFTPTWRHWDTPAGTASLRDTRFPLFSVGGPVPRTHLGLGISIGSYADRDFRLATSDTISLRGQPVGVFDTLTSLGGLNEIRVAAGYALSERTSVGGAIYWITGSSRLEAHRSFSDSTFLSFIQSAELSYQGVGFALGVTHQLTPGIQLAAIVRSDGKASVERDSSKAYNIDLPYSFAAGARVRAAPRLLLAVSGTYRTWSAANSDLLAQGAVGSQNTIELGLGGELVRNVRRPGSLPIRLGVRYADLPFPVVAGEHPKEFVIGAGTGARFAQDRAGVDISLEHAWRSEGSPYKERALSVTFGLSIRPYGTIR